MDNPALSIELEKQGIVYGREKRLDDAIDCFLKSLDACSRNLGAHVNLASAYFLKGDWKKGWPHYERRLEYWYRTGFPSGCFYEIYKPAQAWDGKASLQGKKIVVYCEQGAGDMIQFVRFVPQLTALGAEVFIDTIDGLRELLKGFGKIRNQYDSDYDYHCSVLSLPYLLKVEDFLGDKPYLECKCCTFSFREGQSTKNIDHEDFRVGIVWSGNRNHPHDAIRSVSLSYFKGISTIPGVKLFSLQKEVFADLADNSVKLESLEITDYQSTADLIGGLDLVISVSTSVVLLAGALGKETWALIPYNPDWRWGIEGDKTIWYSSMTLFRQNSPDDWESAFKNIERLLRKKIRCRTD